MQTSRCARKQRQRVRARTVVVCTCLCFVAYQASFFLLTTPFPQLGDPEFGGKLYHLRAHLRAAPDTHPLIIAFGSSHVGLGLRPEDLRKAAPVGSSEPLVFNFALNNSGPLTSLVCLRRLLREGIRPDWALVEPCPLMLWLEGCNARAQCVLDLPKVQRSDLALLSRYYSDAPKFRAAWRAVQVLPWFSHRQSLLNYCLPRWFPEDKRVDSYWRHTDDWGWQWNETLLEPRFVRSADARRTVYETFTWYYGMYSLSEASRLALHEFVLTCQRENIKVALLRMPEAKEFQLWYPPAVRAALDGCFREVSERGAPVIDARDWLPDTAFADGHHLTPEGAREFTKQFQTRVLAPLVAGEPLPAFVSPPGP
jgi:hypothetical protein